MKDKLNTIYELASKDIENAKDSAPTIVKEENVKAKNAFSLCGSMFSLFTIFLVIYSIYHMMAFTIAENKWDSLTTSYNDTQFYKLEETANDLIATAPGNRIDEIYQQIADFTYIDGEISEYEAEMLVEILGKVNNKNLSLLQYNAKMKGFVFTDIQFILKYHQKCSCHLCEW